MMLQFETGQSAHNCFFYGGTCMAALFQVHTQPTRSNTIYVFIVAALPL